MFMTVIVYYFGNHLQNLLSPNPVREFCEEKRPGKKNGRSCLVKTGK